jgi:uncharacterized protein YqgV (UPF0045/DUF77 family)
MKASAEMSMYPLDENYGNVILEFIHRLRAHKELTVQTNNFSTQVFGEYDFLMDTLKKEMKTSFENNEAIVMVMKITNLDLSN